MFCLGAAALAALAHFTAEPTIAPTGAAAWTSLLLIGLGPAGVAFAVWDIGIKKGDLRTLGVLSYATPVLSTLLLVSLRETAPTASLAVACALIAIAGAIVVASPDETASARSTASTAA